LFITACIAPGPCLAQGHQANLPTCLDTIPFLNAERQARKLWIPTFKVFWSDSAMEWNPGLRTTRRTL